MPEDPRQFWIRNDKGTTWGPLTFASIELILSGNALPGTLQASRDGIHFVWPGQLPELRDAFPRSAWGESLEPLPDDVASPVPGPPTINPPGRPVEAPRGVPGVVTAAKAAPEPGATATALLAEGVPASGDLGKVSPLRLYYLIAATNQTGQLTLEGSGARYDVFFKKGSPEAVKPLRGDEDFGAFLVAKGVLNAAQLADAQNVAGALGGDILSALLSKGFLVAADAAGNIAEHAARLLVKAFVLETGTYRFDRAAPPPVIAMPLGDRWKLMSDVVRGTPASVLASRLGAQRDAAIMKSGGRVGLDQLKLAPHEIRAASCFDGVRPLSALCAALPNEADTLVRTAFLLVQAEICTFTEVRAAKAGPSTPAPAPERPPPCPSPGAFDPPPPKTAAPAATPPPAVNPRTPPVIGGPSGRPVVAPPAPAPAGATAGKPPCASAAPLTELAALRGVAQGLQGKNHFQVLGIPETATSALIKTAYFQLAKAYHPDTLAAGAPPEMGKLRAEIFTRVHEAYGIVGDDAKRAEYLEALKAGVEKLDASRIFASEEAFQRACTFLKARRYPEAVKAFDEAIALYNKEGEYIIWRGWATFLLASDKRAAKAEAFKEIDRGLKMSPKCAQALYFKGQIHKLTGDLVMAQKLFKETLAMDPNHIGAAREVRQH